MKYKITILIEGDEETLEDLERGNIENGIQEDVLLNAEKLLNFSWVNLEEKEDCV